MFQEILITFLTLLSLGLNSECPKEFMNLEQNCLCHDRNKVICPKPSINPDHELVIHYNSNDVYFECRENINIESFINGIRFNDVRETVIFDHCDLPKVSYNQWISFMNVSFSKFVLKNLGTKLISSKFFENLQVQKIQFEGIFSENFQDEKVFENLSNLTHLAIYGSKSQNVTLPNDIFYGLNNLEHLVLSIKAGKKFC